MLRKRLINILTFNDGVLFRSKQFNPDYRYTANFVDSWSIDEIILLDITRPDKRDPNKFLNIIYEFSSKCFVPLCVGGGIRNLNDIKSYLDAGADKVSINKLIFTKPEIIKKAALQYGSQCIVQSIDAKLFNEGYFAYTNHGKDLTNWEVQDLAKFAEKLGVGEILLTSIERDGSLEGYDNKLNKLVSDSVNIPVIASGGAGKWVDFENGFNQGGVDAVGTTNIYHFTETSIKSAKRFLKSRSFNVRI